MERANPQVSSSTVSVLAAWTAIVASGAALALLLSLHVLSPEFSPAWRMISEYANGRYNWVLSLMFTAYGASSLSLALAIALQRPNTRGRKFFSGLALLTLAGVAQVSAAQFDLNQATLHDLAGVVGILCLPIAAMLISPSLAAAAASEHARKLIVLAASLTWISIAAWLASFVLMIATFALALGGLPSAPPQELPAGVIAVVGWTNRVMVLCAWGWVVMVAWNVIRLRSRSATTVETFVGNAARKGSLGA